MSTFTLPAVPTMRELTDLAPLQRFASVGGPSVIVNHRSWPVGTPIESVLDGSAVAESATATGDGRHVAPGWHSGPVTDEVYFERYTAEGRVSHGWIDSVSRQLVQAG